MSSKLGLTALHALWGPQGGIKLQAVMKQGIISRLAGIAPLRAEKERMEAFMAAAPGAWCGFGSDSSVAYNAELLKTLGLEKIDGITDIQNALSPSDAAVLEGLFIALQEKGLPFSMNARSSARECVFKIVARRGSVPGDFFHYDVLWFEDITVSQAAYERVRESCEKAEDERDRFQTAFDNFPLPLWMRDARTSITWCNRAYARALETTPATVVAEQREMAVKAARRPLPRASIKAMAQAALDQGSTEQVTAHIILAGRRRLVTVSEIPLPGSRMTLGVAEDITREEELESEQKRSSTAMRELLEHMGSAIGIFNTAQKLEFYNSAFSQLWGIDDKTLNAQPRLGDLMEKMREARRLPEQADFKRYKQSWLNMFTGLLGPHEDMLYLPDGKALRMLVVPHAQGGLMMTFEDVTSRLELESSYNTLIAVQKETLDHLAEGVAVFGGDGRLKLWNPSFSQMWGLNPEDLDGKPHVTKLTEKMKARFDTSEAARAQQILMAQSLERRLQDGRLTFADGLLIQYSTVPLPDGGVLVTHADVTDTVRVENALREKNAALQAAERLKLDFLANVSYQLRTPLNAIMGFTEILAKEYFGSLNDRQREYTAGMQDAGDRLLNLIDDILDLSTIEAGYMELEKSDIRIKSVLEAIGNLTRDWARKEKIEIRIECPDDIGFVQADERRLKQALLNLVRNAITYTPAGGLITLSAVLMDAEVRLSVKDTGPGIAPEDRERIFEPFERSAAGVMKAKSTGRGAGLGLSLVKSIAEMHGGRIDLDSRAGLGSTFTVVLPA